MTARPGRSTHSEELRAIVTVEERGGSKGNLPITEEGVELVHPVYLDVPMMVSFLAASEGGVTFSSQETHTATGRRSRTATGKVNIAGIAGLLGLGASGSLEMGSDQTQEIQMERQFTAASLFAVLRTRLRYDLGAISVLASPADLDGLSPGTLVEMSGTVTSDPALRALSAVADLANLAKDVLGIRPLSTALEAYLSTQNPGFAMAMGWLQPSVAAPATSQRKLPGGGATAKARSTDRTKVEDLAEQVSAFLARVADGMAVSAVTDYTLETPDAGLRAVLTLSTALLPPEGGLMLASEMTALGKVTRVLSDDDEIDLLRRGVLGYLPTETVQQTLKALDNALHLSLPGVLLRGPGVQILPLAIFV